MLRLVLADDHSLVLDGLRALLEMEEGMEVLAFCADGGEAVRAVEELQPDVVILDAGMPEVSGVEAATRIREMDVPTRIIMLSAALGDRTLLQCLDLELEGLVLKESASTVLTEAIKAVADGERWLPPELVRRGMDLLTRRNRDAGEGLTPRELDVARQVMEGRSNKAAARHLGITVGTVKAHLYSIYRKLGVSNRVELALLGLEELEG